MSCCIAEIIEIFPDKDLDVWFLTVCPEDHQCQHWCPKTREKNFWTLFMYDVFLSLNFHLWCSDELFPVFFNVFIYCLMKFPDFFPFEPCSLPQSGGSHLYFIDTSLSGMPLIPCRITCSPAFVLKCSTWCESLLLTSQINHCLHQIHCTHILFFLRNNKTYQSQHLIFCICIIYS